MMTNDHPETTIFWKTAGELVEHAPIILSLDDDCGHAVNAICEAKASAGIIIDDSKGIAGIITEQDVVRKLSYRVPEATPLKDVMSQPVRTIAEDDYLYHAIAVMQRFGLRHIPVLDDNQHPIGMLQLDKALSAVAPQRLAQVDLLAQEDTISGLREVKAVQAHIARQLFSENIPVPHILGVLTHINNGIYRSLLEANIKAMAKEGLGSAPVKFAVIIMGSGGRRESYLYPDQDNGFILEDYPDEDHDRIDSWFIELADRLTQQLDQVGIPLCNGYVMAINPLWRKTISQWRAQTTGWIKKQSPMAIRFADIFFDFQSVYGQHSLATELQQHISKTVKNAHGFLNQLYHDDSDIGVPLGWFGRLKTISDDPERKGQIALKHSGLLPMIQSVRLLALKAGILETSTLGRIAELRAIDMLSTDLADELEGAYANMSFMLLRHQLEAQEAGRAVDYFVNADRLTRRERRLLVNAFKAIQDLMEKTKYEISGEIF